LIAGKNSVATETYLIVDMPDTVEEAENLISYMRTRFFRFLVSLIKTTQNISKGSFAFVPVQDLTGPWTDAALSEKYGLTHDEIAFIESMIRPMELSGDTPDE
jgi:site-specific DNA-methyltransferase (adenine-specific)